MSIYLAHRRADRWPDPASFRPERFVGARPGSYEFLPFGGGARRCLGMAFALYAKLADFGGVPEGIALDSTGHILLGDVEGGTNCHTFGGCGALYQVDRSTGARTILGNFGDPAQGPLGEDAGKALALDTDGTILVVDPFAPPGSPSCFDTQGCGSIFRWDSTSHIRSSPT